MKSVLLQNAFDETLLIQERLIQNPLVKAIKRILGRVSNFKERAQDFYFEVVLSPYRCPQCSGKLCMTGQSECSCSCGYTFDPTLAFQKSTCCGARLVRKTFHYTCSKCQKTVPSRFLFDEKLFDKIYFREMMKESRERAKSKKEEIRRLLSESRSGALTLMEEPCLEAITGLVQDLNYFVQTDSEQFSLMPFDTKSEFHMNDYRDHILSILGWGSTLFSDIRPLNNDSRQDRIWRFITLVFMQNDREVDLTQDGSDLWVQKVYNEAYT